MENQAEWAGAAKLVGSRFRDPHLIEANVFEGNTTTVHAPGLEIYGGPVVRNNVFMRNILTADPAWSPNVQ